MVRIYAEIFFPLILFLIGTDRKLIGHSIPIAIFYFEIICCRAREFKSIEPFQRKNVKTYLREILLSEKEKLQTQRNIIHSLKHHQSSSSQSHNKKKKSFPEAKSPEQSSFILKSPEHLLRVFKTSERAPALLQCERQPGLAQVKSSLRSKFVMEEMIIFPINLAALEGVAGGGDEVKEEKGGASGKVVKIWEDILGFENCEFYIKKWPQLYGMQFEEVVISFPDAIPCGIKVSALGGKIILNPDDNYVLQEEDEVSVIAEDDDTYAPSTMPMWVRVRLLTPTGGLTFDAIYELRTVIFAYSEVVYLLSGND
ncbi:putative ion channel CASTOR [Platanthera zijinensis]|uniref:Ion channel CASTOR n=1 Tax=Platanthera zijinensis TaxID=2320716 RepID=A0AAP0BEP9_9ASPA